MKLYLIFIIILIMKVPRTQHLANIHPNHIYSLNAQVCYVHHTPKMTTAIIEDEGVQSTIKIPQSANNIRQQIENGMNYHFGFCYITPNWWICVRNPDTSIHSIDDKHIVQQPMNLCDIAIHSQTLNDKYLTTLLYVIKVNSMKQIIKNNKKLTLCIIHCFANGYLVDVSVWNSDLPLDNLNNRWVIFSGFRLKKLVDWKFLLVSSVYSQMAVHEENVACLPYTPFTQYHNLSSIFEPRTITEISMIPLSSNKYYSQTEALIKESVTYTYQACSTCHKKIGDELCECSLNCEFQMMTYLKVLLVDSNWKSITGVVFDEETKNYISNLREPQIIKLNIRTEFKAQKNNNNEVIASHVIKKIIL